MACILRLLPAPESQSVAVRASARLVVDSSGDHATALTIRSHFLNNSIFGERSVPCSLLLSASVNINVQERFLK